MLVLTEIFPESENSQLNYSAVPSSAPVARGSWQTLGSLEALERIE